MVVLWYILINVYPIKMKAILAKNRLSISNYNRSIQTVAVRISQRTFKVLGLVCCSLLLASCQLDGEFYISMEKLKQVENSGETMKLPAKFFVPSPKADNCESAMDITSNFLQRYFNEPKTEYCGVMHRTEKDETVTSYRLEKGEFMTEYQTNESTGVTVTSYGVVAVDTIVPVSHDTMPEQYFSFFIERNNNDSITIKLHINTEMHDAMLIEAAEFSNATVNGRAVIDLGRFDIELHNDSSEECQIQANGQTSFLQPNERESFRISDLNFDGERSLTIDNCIPSESA